jgi:hypothetical protein
MSYDYADSALDQHEINLLRAENDILREVLKFYADEKNHHRKWPCQSLVDVDRGKTARDALEKR